MFANNNPLLFSNGNLHAWLEQCQKRVVSRVDGLPEQQLLSLSTDTLVEGIAGEMRIDPLELLEDQKELEQDEASVDVSHDRDRNFGWRSSGPLLVAGTRLEVSIPFWGDPSLWSLQPNSFDFNPPRGNVRSAVGDQPGRLVLVLEQPSDDPPDKLKRLLDSQIDSVKRYVANQRAQVNHFNELLPGLVARAINARRQRLEANSNIVRALGIPLKRNKEAPEIQPIHLKRTIRRPLPTAPASGFQPEPAIPDEEYEYILRVLRHEGSSYEATPSTFSVHDEEELRDIILAHLNGHYEGGATGETFRKRGKTDIRIEHDTRAAFVAECKMWRGPQSFADAVDQLLGYLTWRDGKTALVFFNVSVKGFKGIQDRLPTLISEHPLFLRTKSTNHAGEWRAVFRLKDDELREVTVHVFLFDLYVAD